MDNTVLIIAGRGFGQYREVTDNTAQTLTVGQPWRVVPDATSQYVVGPMMVESALFANLNDSPGRLSLWLDCIGNIVDMHRDVQSKGIDIWGRDGSAVDAAGKVTSPEKFNPSYYNTVTDSWMDGSYLWLYALSAPENLYHSPVLFGNYVMRNRIRGSYLHRTAFAAVDHSEGAVVVGNRSGPDMTKPRDTRVAASHSFILGNNISFTNLGITVADTSWKTFILGNQFEEVPKPLLDFGARTVMQKNTVYSFDGTGEHITPIPDSVNPREIAP